MATPGSKWKISKVTIVTALKECRGKVTHAAKKLNVAPITLRKRINKYPELKQLVEDLRNDFDETILDMAETCILATIAERKDDPSLALKSSMYALNSKGKSRGWNNTFIDSTPKISLVDVENLQMENNALKRELDNLRNQSQAG